MTAVSGQPARAAPRVLLRLFWAGHRLLYRVTGGRLGLTRPETGKRFGMLRLETVGRRSGQRRAAMIGYYEDGPNLVTMAMNGWGQPEPAWWLNLRATPDATVTLRDGRRQVHARTATGVERDRLWANFRNYPGWGENLDGLAALRPRETTVIVLEPQGVRDAASPEGKASP
jgi:deazaflavin-dependent oxidoreductase (nitroreductase family)